MLNDRKNGRLLAEYIILLGEEGLHKDSKRTAIVNYESEITNRLSKNGASLGEMVSQSKGVLALKQKDYSNFFHQVWATLRPWARGEEEEIKDIQRTLTFAMKGKIINNTTEKAA